MATGPGCTLSWCVSHAGLPHPLPPARLSPGPGCHPHKTATQTGTTDVHHQSNHAGQGTHDQRDGNSQSPKLGTRHSIWPRPAVPPTVLGSDMSHGSLFLHDWPDASSADLCLPDTVPLTQELAAALGSMELAFCSDRGEAR